MAQKKSHEVDAFINRPNNSFPIILLYGPDKGLVSERAKIFAKATKLPLEDPFTVIRMEGDEVEKNPGMLHDEAMTISMFGGKRLIWIRNISGQKPFADLIKHLAAEPPQDAIILMEAGDLKKGAALRTAVENGSAAMALPCYNDDARGIDGVIDDVLSAAHLQISGDARQLLRISLGGDRLASRGELEKLCLYAQGKTRIELEDIRACIGDVSMVSTDEIIDALLLGDMQNFNSAFDRLITSGTAPFLILNAAIRQFQQLQMMRYSVDVECKTPATIIASARPPFFYTRRKKMEKALSCWQASSITRAGERLQKAVLESRQNNNLAVPIIRQCLMALVVEAARNNRQ